MGKANRKPEVVSEVQEKVKQCTKCKQVKPLDDFCVDKRTKSGRYSQCRKCHSENLRKNRKKYYYREKATAYRKRWRAEPQNGIKRRCHRKVLRAVRN